jgi:hypothetical protein
LRNPLEHFCGHSHQQTALDFSAWQFKSLKTRTLQKAKSAAPETSNSKARQPAVNDSRDDRRKRNQRNHLRGLHDVVSSFPAALEGAG